MNKWRDLNEKRNRHSEFNRRYNQAIQTNFNCKSSQLCSFDRSYTRQTVKRQMKAERKAVLGQQLVDNGPKFMSERQMDKLVENPEEVQNLMDKWGQVKLSTLKCKVVPIKVLNKVRIQYNKDPSGLSPYEVRKILPILLASKQLEFNRQSKFKPGSHWKKCREHFKLDEFKECIIEADLSIANNESEDAQVLYFKGVSLKTLNQPINQVLDCLNQSIQLAEHSYSIFVRGRAFMDIKDYDSAILDFKKSLDIISEEFDSADKKLVVRKTKERLLQCFYESGRFDESLELIGTIDMENVISPWTWYYASCVYYEFKNYANGLYCAYKGLEFNPLNRQIVNKLNPIQHLELS